jgi:hypothetical protein
VNRADLLVGGPETMAGALMILSVSPSDPEM